MLKKFLLYSIQLLTIFLSTRTVFSQSRDGFFSFKEAHACFKAELSKHNCTFSIKPLSPTSRMDPIKYECIQNEGKGKPILRVVGDFNHFKIVCSAFYPIDLDYYGILPNEAIFVNWWKELDVISETLGSPKDRFLVEAEILSVDALFTYSNNPNNSLYEYHNDGLPYKVKYDYPRTGNYTFPGIFNKEKDMSFYFVLEDGAKPEFLRNNRTIATVEENRLFIPCLPSHWEAVVELTNPPLDKSILKYNRVDGFSIPIVEGQDLNGEYTCILKHQGTIVDTLTLQYRKGQISYLYGFLEVTENATLSRIEIDKANVGKYTTINPTCVPEEIRDNVPENIMLVSVPMYNFGYMRLRQLFALPEYYNRSYNTRVSYEYDVLIRKMKIESSTTLRMFTVYCRFGHSVRIADFGSSVTVSVAVPFAFGRDWAKFDRSKSNVATHFVLSTVPKEQILYIDSVVTFSCKVNIPVVVKPVVWYTLRANGSYIRESIDYDLNMDVSTFQKKLTIDVKEILCFGSYWYSEWFRNITLPLPLIEGILPTITATNTKFLFRKESGTRNIKCEATGKPEPTVYFKRYGKLVGTSLGSSTFLDIEIDESSAGIYTCVASNGLGIEEKDFVIEVDDVLGSDGVNLGVVIAIPVFVFLITLLGAYIYIKFFRPEKTGLTKQEIEEFVKGLKVEELGGNKGEYAHEFAHLVPYTGEYEVSPTNFKIDLADVLGSGAYGMVLKGLLDGDEVAVKTIKRNADKQYLKALLSELKIMIYLGQHPNLIQVLGAYTKELSKGMVYVFVKYLPHGSLENFLRSHKSHFLGSTEYMNTIANRLDTNSFGVEDLLRWTTELANGMEYLSRKKVIHGDLAARNILLDEDKSVRITDFGLSRQLYDYSDYVKKQQEPLPWRWMALESLKFLSFSTSSDVWSFGITVWEIFSLGEVPYPGYSWTLQFVEELENGLRMTRPKFASHLIYVLLTQCWHQTPEKRPTFSVLKEEFTKLMNTKEEETGEKK